MEIRFPSSNYLLQAMYGMTETSPLIFQSLASDAVQQAAATVGVVTDHMEVRVAHNYLLFIGNDASSENNYTTSNKLYP